MKAIHRTFTSLASLGALTVLCQATALAQTTNAITSTPVEQTTPTEEEKKRFHACELDLSPFGAWVDKIPGNKWGGGAALTFYPIEYLGIGVSSYLMNFKGTAIDNVEGEAYLRLPICQVVAPYAVGGAGYAFDGRYGFETVGAGVDFRPIRHISVFSDGQFRFSNNNSRQDSGPMVRIGLRFSF